MYGIAVTHAEFARKDGVLFFLDGYGAGGGYGPVTGCDGDDGRAGSAGENGGTAVDTCINGGDGSVAACPGHGLVRGVFREHGSVEHACRGWCKGHLRPVDVYTPDRYISCGVGDETDGNAHVMWGIAARFYTILSKQHTV